MLRIFRFFRELRTVASSILHCLRSLTWVLIVLCFILFVVAIFFVQVTSDFRKEAGAGQERESAELASLFGSLIIGVYTLFMGVTGGKDWGDVTDKLQVVHWSLVLAFALYIGVMMFAVLNIITGVFVNGAITEAQKERETKVQDEISKEKHRRKELERIFGILDVDKNGFIDIHELERAMEREDVLAVFRLIQLDVSDAWKLFRFLDRDKTFLVNMDDFIFGCLQVSGNARHIDMAVFMDDMKKSLTLLHRSVLDLCPMYRHGVQPASQSVDFEETLRLRSEALMQQSL